MAYFTFWDLRIHTLKSTDEGVAFLVRVKEKTFFHAGDLNWWYWEEEDDTYKMSKADKKLVSMISENYKEDYEHVKTGNPGEDLYLRFLMVTDYISGMTDSYAKNLYRELNGMD